MKRRLLLPAVLCLTLSTACGWFTKTVYVDRLITIPVPETPASPEYFDVKWTQQGDLFCLDEQNAKHEMKNVLLLKAHDEDLIMILDGMRARTKETK